MASKPEPGTPQAIGLKWRSRASGAKVPYWIAPAEAVKAGYPVKSVNLTGLADDELVARCDRLTSEVKMWRDGLARGPVLYDGTFATLFELYETDEQSPYRKLRPGSLVPYKSYLRKLRAMIGAMRIDQQTGLDLMRWHKIWRAPTKPGDPEKLGAAAMATAVLKAALKYGVAAKLRGCHEFRVCVFATELERPKAREIAPTAAEIVAAREAAHATGQHSLALAYAIQFETSIRQWDVIGEWLPLSDPAVSSVLAYGQKWVGLDWSMIDGDLILRMTPSKTLRRSGAAVEIDLALCPMVLEEIARIPPERRVGPVVISEKTALPWVAQNYRYAWRKIRKAAGIGANVWNRDLRAGGLTEARKGGATLEDASRMAGHKGVKTMATVYDRDKLEATRRAQASRAAFRGSKNIP